ncbi:MAG: hypothetical protein OXI69_10520 [Acidobacteriota bacterium]|nr:hypothetical protein [Acidobacteriota bacterium]
MTTKGTKTQKEQNEIKKFVLCLLWLDSIAHQGGPDIEKGRASRLPAKFPAPLRILQKALVFWTPVTAGWDPQACRSGCCF